MNIFTFFAKSTNSGLNSLTTRKISIPFFTLLMCMLAMKPAEVNAQSIGDYRSVADGNWEVAENWQRFDGVDWVPTLNTPTASDGVINLGALDNAKSDKPYLLVGDYLLKISGPAPARYDLIISIGTQRGEELDLSDVDVVVELTSTYTIDTSALSLSQIISGAAGFIPASYTWSVFRNDVLRALRDYYGRFAVTRREEFAEVICWIRTPCS